MQKISPALSPAAAKRLAEWLDGGWLPEWAQTALEELIAANAWDELEDRFFRELSFGTGGMRGRVIGRHPAPSELGPGGVDAPQHPAIGANTMNDVTVARATMGLYRSTNGKHGKPRLIIAHDVRHFSRRFAELSARVWASLGGDVWLFTGPCSTPQLSFTVRALGADTGVVLTASHNPPHDNGYKVYAAHGGQVIPPLADQIVQAVRAVQTNDLKTLLRPNNTVDRWKLVPPELEEQYMDAVAQVVLNAPIIRERKPCVAFSALHGTGGVVIPKLLRRLGANVMEVAAQADFDARFPTVPSPNPEDPRALAQVLAQAQTAQADVGLATDPDADRIGTVYRELDGSYRALNGNELGVLLADYRLRRAKELGWLAKEGSPNAVILKTFVTTPMLEAVASAHGIRSVNTLTGFKWMGAKLHRYEDTLFAALSKIGDRRTAVEIAALPLSERVALSLRHSTWMVLAAEESYGCLAGDAARDKDANAAAAMCAELAAWLAAPKVTATAALDSLYVQHGFHREALRTLTFEGAAGVAQIQRALASLRSEPPATLGGRKVTRTMDFLNEMRRDEEGEIVPKEDFLLYELTGDWRCAIRGSGTEPKVKMYFFVREAAHTLTDLPKIKKLADETAKAWIEAIVLEVRARAGS